MMDNKIKSEEAILIALGVGEKSTYPESTVQALFEKQATERPDAVALIFGAERMTYRELNERANRLAHQLIANGVEPGQGVALFLERGVSQIVATLAVLKAGAAYIPLDVEFPAARIFQMLEDARPSLILSCSTVVDHLTDASGIRLLNLDEIEGELERESTDNPAVECGCDSLAYIMYTSGSTGRPKGVEVVHRGIIRLLFGVDYVPLNSDTVILHMAAVSFDASTFETWGALLHGGVCVLSPSRVPSLETIGRLLEEHRVNTFWMTASLFNLAVAEAPEILEPVKYLLTGGEALSHYPVEKVLRELPEVQLINGYGPTENTTFSTTYTFDRNSFDPSKPIPIGRAIGNSSCYILDSSLHPVPVGMQGELYVGGDGIARGYAGRPDLTAERFLADPFSDKPGARMYKTGDIVYWNSQGLIEFIGRKDHQVKLRGFRIELQEIDMALESFPSVEQAVTMVYEDEGRGKWLAAFVKVARPDQFPVAELEKQAYEQLPDYMVPAVFVPVAEWSYTPSGKLDRNALPRPELGARLVAEFQPLETKPQQALGEIWQRLLNLQQVGLDNNFFELGGDSLLGVHLIHEISQYFGTELSLATLVRQPTIRGLASILDENSIDEAQLEGFRCLQLIQPGDPAVPPLFMIHGGAGNVAVFREFAQYLGSHQSVYAFQWSGWDGHRGHETIVEMASAYKEELLRFLPLEKYRLGGHCIGGLVAVELARQLREEGIGIDGPLIVTDCPNLESVSYRRAEPESTPTSRADFLRMAEELRSRSTASAEWSMPELEEPSSSLSTLLKRYAAVVSLVRWAREYPTFLKLKFGLLRGEKVPVCQRQFYSSFVSVASARCHTSPHYPDDVVYFRSACVLARNLGLTGWWDDPFMGFGELCEGTFEGHVLGGGHDEVLGMPEMADVVKKKFDMQT